MKDVDEHLAQCLAAVGVLAPIPLSLLDALDCVLAEDVVAAIALPSFDNSAMDGYAVHVPDVSGASELFPVVLAVLGDVPAGAGEPPRLPAGATLRIMTGAPLPAGADAVVPVEWTNRGIEEVAIRQVPGVGQFLRRTGEDVGVGELVLHAGIRLSARHLGLLAALGRGRVLVHPRPRVAVLSTGSELVEPGLALGFGQIHDANGYGLAAAAAELGAVAQHCGIVADDPRQVLEALHDRAATADLLITSGGVSAGAYDTVKEVLRSLGTVTFDRVAMQPGMPQGFGSVGTVPIFTLPGNPVSSLVSFEVFVRPVLRKMFGEISLHRHLVPATATHAWSSPAGKRQFVRARIERREDGASLVTPVGGQGSHLVADLAQATCLAVVPEDITEIGPGDTVRCMILDRSRR